MIAFQTFSISNSDAVSKRQYQKKKTHEKANVRNLIEIKIAEKKLKAHETLESRAITSEQNNR